MELTTIYGCVAWRKFEATDWLGQPTTTAPSAPITRGKRVRTLLMTAVSAAVLAATAPAGAGGWVSGTIQDPMYNRPSPHVSLFGTPIFNPDIEGLNVRMTIVCTNGENLHVFFNYQGVSFAAGNTPLVDRI